MKHGRTFTLLVAFMAIVISAELTAARSGSSVSSATADLQIAVRLDRLKVSGGESVSGRVEVRRNGNTQELVFRLEVNNPSVRLSTREIRLNPAESSATFEVSTISTPIKTTVDVRALLQPADQLQAQKTLEIVPALLKQVTLLKPTMPGTHGGTIAVRAELNVNAPQGGIELYLDMIAESVPGKVLTLESPNPRIAAGSRELSFDIAYDKITVNDQSIASDRTTFNQETRRVGLVVALEAQLKTPWAVIPGISKRVSFDVIPLRVASISVQPTVVSGGAESLATFTLNIPPGTNETLRLLPGSATTSEKAWARLLGTSCQSSVLLVQLPLTAGVTNYSFKVCTASVTTSTFGTLNVIARSGAFPVQITVQP